MPNFTPEAMRKIMGRPSNIRNISIIAHVDHGKTTLTDSLIAACGIIRMDQAGDVGHTDTMELEKQKGITIKSTGISLYFDMSTSPLLPQDGSLKDFVINLVDSPGHVDFSSEVTAALRVTDGALVIVDCIEGVCVQTETVLRQALTERIRPVLCVNKLDRAFLELQFKPEEMYQNFSRIIESVNVSIATFSDEAMGEYSLSPENGTVAFCAGKQAWAFTLNTFARILAKKFKLSEAKMVQRLWGDNFWDPYAKEWITTSISSTGKKLQRGFCQYVLEPLQQVFELGQANKKEQLETLLSKVGVTVTKEDKEKSDKMLIKACLQRWLPAHEALLEMIVLHLPSPAMAQQYRVETLYEGPMDDPVANAIRNCDPNGPLMVYISKLVPDKNNRFWAFGRVFSGTAKTGAKVRVMNTNYIPGSKEHLAIKSLQRILIMMGKFTESVEDVPCGNTVGLVGIDDAILKTATITDHEAAFPLKQMKYSVSPVVRCAVFPDSPSNLLKLLEGLKKLSKIDPLVQCSFEETGEHVVAAAGELHLEICLHQLREITGIEIKTSDPVVTFKETVTQPSSIVCLSKSANKHNRLYVKAQPLGEDLTKAIEDHVIFPLQDSKVRSKLLSSDYGWEPDGGRKIWCFGPSGSGANLVVDVTKGQQEIAEIQDSVVAAFQWFSESGALCEENLRGCRFNVVDAHLHSDSIHRGAGQIIPTAKRVFSAAQLTAHPRLQEPIFLVEIQCPTGSTVGSIHSVLSQRRGYIVEEIPRPGTNLCNIKAHLPVMESFGFTTALRAATSGQAFPQLMFDHWSLLNESPFEEGKVKQIITSIRKRKGLSPEIPPLDRYLDRL